MMCYVMARTGPQIELLQAAKQVAQHVRQDPALARKAFLRKVAWVGGATTVLALFTVYLLVAHSSVYGKFSWESILTLVIVLGAGPVIYLIARQVRRQRNSLDLTMAMRELPPE